MHSNPPSDALPAEADLPPGLGTAVESLRRQLLDISKRNRLTNAPVGKNRSKQLDIEDELSDEVFRMLYAEGRKMTFDPATRDTAASIQEEEFDEVFVPAEQRSPDSGPRARHVDTKLQTRLTAEALQKRLLTLFRDAQALEEEQGISVLFLALGFLRWYESESSEIERFAPLILLPADLQRESVRGRFKLVYRDQDLEPNLSLRAMLSTDFDLDLPDFPEGEGWRPSEYFRAVGEAVSSQPRWEVRANLIELSFYSFAKFLMWKDLSPDNDWGQDGGLDGHELLESLLVGGFESSGSIFAPDENLDTRFPDPRELGHILDADASQTQVIAAARDGRNLVVQGPPGTGKSQTIANIVGVAAKEGKRVLFVAEKRAALDVVHDRLEKCGLGPLCLELHSHKANRKQIYADLKKTLNLYPPGEVDGSEFERVREVRDELNRVSALLHKVDEATGDTPYGIIGRLAKLSERDTSRPTFEVPGADAWSRAAFEERCKAVAVLAKLTAEYGCESEHVWRGARKRLTPLDRKRLADTLHAAVQRLDTLLTTLQTAENAASMPEDATVKAAEIAASQLDALSAIPEAVPHLLGSATLLERTESVLELCEDVANLQERRASLLAGMTESALKLQWEQVRLDIAARGRSWFRWLSGRYRNAVATLRSVQRVELPKGLADRLRTLDGLIEYQGLDRSVSKRAHLGREVFGYEWRDDETDLRRLLPAVRWIASRARKLGAGEAVKRQVESIPPGHDLARLANDLRSLRDRWMESWQGIARAIDLDVVEAFAAESVEKVGLDRLQGRLDAWSRNMDAIEGWHRLGSAARHVSELGLGAIRERLGDGRIETEDALEQLEFLRAEAVWERMRGEEQSLEEIDGQDRSANIEKFKRLDQQLQSLAAQEIALRHFGAIPSGASGQIGIVRGEVNKKIRHMPVRKLLDKAGDAVAAIKPVFLMSPLSVAQYLTPGRLTFDLLLIDEASQVRPADAMGAVMRSRQIVVVGDQKQMPPTSFFDRQVGGEDDVDFEDAADIQASQVGDMESILSLCEARSMPGGMLRWHYRSKHPSLIEVSNHEFYENGLIFPPSPYTASKETGLAFEYVQGVYARGRKRNNPQEAEAIVEAVLSHARKKPDQTLGVVALSVAQRDTIRDKLEFKRNEFPELDAFCKEGKEDAFFVKNLENVQGDERDVIFISIGYGKDSGGYMSQSFGPVSSDGGERRLNVLFTRAKVQCRVFSSIRHGDIRIDVTKNAGPRVLKRFLKFAETGELDIPLLTGGEPDSPFEEAVATALANHGYKVAGQVGSSGFKIDLAVYDPDDEGRFLLAIECDGARYHSSSWARERDRLRQIVLEQKGWRFHRIWSTDWFYARESEMHKLLDAIERARSDRNGNAKPVAPPSRRSVERVELAPEPEPERVRYVEARFGIPESRTWRMDEVDLNRLGSVVAKVVEVEGPVHIDEVARRLSRLWGYARTGKRIKAAVREGARRAVNNGRIRYESPASRHFLDRPERSELPVRDRSGASPTIRMLDMLPPSEVQSAIVMAVERNIGISPSECAVEVARMLGYRATSAGMRRLVSAQAQKLVAAGRLLKAGSELRLP